MTRDEAEFVREGGVEMTGATGGGQRVTGGGQRAKGKGKGQ